MFSSVTALRQEVRLGLKKRKLHSLPGGCVFFGPPKLRVYLETTKKGYPENLHTVIEGLHVVFFVRNDYFPQACKYPWLDYP